MKINCRKVILSIMSISVMTITLSMSSYAGQWQESGPTWKYLKDDGGVAANQWIVDNGQWYHFDSNGILETGWIMDNGKYYFLGSGGAMYVNRMTPTGYYLGSDGAWIPDYTPPISDDSSDNSSTNSSTNESETNTPSSSGGNYELENGLTSGPG